VSLKKKELKKFGEEIASAESRWLGEPGRAEIRAIVKKYYATRSL